MNPMIKTLKKQGFKAALPLLLLATACDGKTLSASAPSSSAISSDGSGKPAVVADTSAFAGLASGETLLPKNVLPKTDKSEDVDTVMAQAKDAAFTPTVAKVPEPATLAGLAISAIGLGAVKRKRAA